MNRIDATIAYQPLDDKALNQILDLQLERIQHHINVRLGSRAFEIEVSPKLKKFLLENGTSPEYGARELKRTIQRFILQPLSKVIIRGQIPPGSQVELELKNKKTILFSITAEEEKFMEELEG
jgi:ATP-dependent Clp protease ATP-binding subunit ClpA